MPSLMGLSKIDWEGSVIVVELSLELLDGFGFILLVIVLPALICTKLSRSKIEVEVKLLF